MAQIELKNIKLLKSLSEETPAYTAVVYLDGKKAAEVSNHGHGGPDMVHWVWKDAEARVEAHFASLPPTVCEYFPEGLPQTLECWCHTTVWDQDMIKSIRRSKKLSGITTDGKELEWKCPATDLPRVRASIEARHPGIRFFCEMTDAQILAIAKGEKLAA